MVSLRYFEPGPAIRTYMSCLYAFETPFAVTDMLRSEVPNLRVILKGGVTVRRGAEVKHFRAPCVILCGATFNAGQIEMTPGTTLIGASILPSGWQACFGLDADEMTDCFEECEGLAPQILRYTVAAMQEAPTSEIAILHLERALHYLGSRRQLKQQPFMEAAAYWLAIGDLGRVDNLVELTDMSRRQVERLCLRHFGGSPKRLQRKFRTLRASNAMVWNETADWQDVAGEDYYDQSHFIRDFREFIGTTPGEFAQDYRVVMRAAMTLRRTINHVHPISLVA